MMSRIYLHDLKDHLTTHSQLVCVPYHLHLCARWDLVDLNDMHMFSLKEICVVTIFIEVYLSRICVICTINTFRPGWDLSDLPDLHILREIRRVCTICMILTCLSVRVIALQNVYNLQDPHDLPEWNLCHLYDLCTGIGYVRSA